VVPRQARVGKRGQVRRLLALFAVAAAIALGSWSSASANALKVTDIGTVVGGYDGLGLFGTAGTDLVGDSYEAVFTFDLSGLSGGYNDGSLAYAYGGQIFGGSSTFVSEIVTINGVSAPTFGDSAGEVLAENGSTLRAVALCGQCNSTFHIPDFQPYLVYFRRRFFRPQRFDPARLQPVRDVRIRGLSHVCIFRRLLGVA
jgi:hypothetical protein